MASYDQDIAGRLTADLQKEFGWTREQAAGFVGNLAVESAGFKTLQEVSPTVRGSRGGFGYAQWTGVRRNEFETWANAKNLDPRSYEANKGYIVHEIRNTEHDFDLLDEMKRAKTVEQAAKIAQKEYFRPGVPHTDRRVALAKQVYSQKPVEAVRENRLADARLADAWGYQDPNTTRGLTTPANTPMPGGLLGDPRGMRDLSAGLLGGVAPPSARPAGMGLAMPTPTARSSNMGRPGVPTPMSRPSPAMATPTNFAGPAGSFRSQLGQVANPQGTAVGRMAPAPMSDRQITAAVPGPSPEAIAMARSVPSMNPRSPMDRPTPTAAPEAPGLFSMAAKASTMPNSATGGLLGPDDRVAQASQFGAQAGWGKPQGASGTWDAPAPTPTPSPTNFAGPMGSPRAAGVPDYQAPAPREIGRPTTPAFSYGTPEPGALGQPPVPGLQRAAYSRPDPSYQHAAFSPVTPQIDALGQPPIPGLQPAQAYRATPQAPVEEIGDVAPDLPAPRSVAPAPTIAGPIGRQQQDRTQTRSNINAEPADRNMAQVAASSALSEVANRGSGGLFSGGFSGMGGIAGGAMLGGAMGGLPGMAIGGLLGSESVRNAIGLGNMGGNGGHGTGQLSAGALAALNSGWGGFGNMNATQEMAVGLARQQAEQEAQQASQGGLFGGWGFSGNEASSSAIGGRTTSYSDGRTSKGGNGSSANSSRGETGGLW